MLPLREAWTAGVKVGLGSDISGGYRVGIDESMRWAVGISRLRAGAQGKEEESRAITWKEAIYLATLGGAEAMGLDDRVGLFEVGKAFDAQWIERKGSRVDWFDRLDVEEKCEKWWCNGREEDRVGVWVQGRRLRGS
jgi:guanine deaminase